MKSGVTLKNEQKNRASDCSKVLLAQYLLFFRVNDCLGQIKFNQAIVLLEFSKNTILL